MKKITLSLLTIAIFAICGCKKESPIPPIASDYEINSWIKINMDQYYLWNTIMPAIQPNASIKPEYYFELLRVKGDRWSYITNDARSLIDELIGTPKSNGIEADFAYLNSSKTKVGVIVLFVYKNSPAERAGVKRGDIITEINNQTLNAQNYTLFFTDSYTATISKYSNEIFTEVKQVQLTSEQLTVSPAVFDTVFETNSKKIGYLVISSFTTIDNFKPSLTSSILNLKNQNINELIIDLRYNRGGSLESVQWLASVLAPSSVSANNTLVSLVYNNIQGAKYTNDDKILKFTTPEIKANINNITFLTANNTASASELLIVGLAPYMNNTTIGDTTYGKYVGSVVLFDQNPIPRHWYAMMPITFKYLNALGFTDFGDGLFPDYALNENIFDLYPLGDINDPVLNLAVANISGVIAKRKAYQAIPQYVLLKTPEMDIKSNLIYDLK